MDERLGRRVGGKADERLEGGGRGEVEHGAAAALDHPGDERAAELVQRGDVELDHLALAVLVGLIEAAVLAEPGVVGQPGHVALAPQQLGREGRARLLVAEVAGVDVGRARAELGAQLVEALAAAGDERDVVAAARELAGELGADAGRGAGDEDGGVGRGIGQAHSAGAYPGVDCADPAA